MKKILVAMAIIAGSFQMAQAQEEGKFRAGLDFGYAIPDGGGGISFGIEPKYNISDNMNVGIRFESAIMAKNVPFGDIGTVESKLAASASYLGTFDYYFSNGSSSFAPFVGAGVGYSALANVEIDLTEIEGFEEIEGEETTAKGELDGKFGGLIRAGFEFGKVRLAASYNLIGKSEVDGTEIKNSYFGISLGFYVGGGKWKK